MRFISILMAISSVIGIHQAKADQAWIFSAANKKDGGQIYMKGKLMYCQQNGYLINTNAEITIEGNPRFVERATICLYKANPFANGDHDYPIGIYNRPGSPNGPESIFHLTLKSFNPQDMEQEASLIPQALFPGNVDGKCPADAVGLVRLMSRSESWGDGMIGHCLFKKE